MSLESLTNQARYITRKYGAGPDLISDSDAADDPPEIQKAVARGVKLGQTDVVKAVWTGTQRKLIRNAPRLP